MVQLKINYATPENITISLAGLANNASRSSAGINNTVTKYIDAILNLKIKLQAGTPNISSTYRIYFYGSTDGINFTDNSLGLNANITLRTPTNLIGPFIVSTPNSGALNYPIIIPSVASYFNGILPNYWGIVIQNSTSIVLSTTENDHIKNFVGISLESI